MQATLLGTNWVPLPHRNLLAENSSDVLLPLEPIQQKVAGTTHLFHKLEIVFAFFPATFSSFLSLTLRHI